MQDVTNVNKNVDTCVMCGAVIPEGRHVCPICVSKIKAIPRKEHEEITGKADAIIQRMKKAAYNDGYKVGADHHTRFTMAAFALYMDRKGYSPQQIVSMVNGMTEIAAQYSTGSELIREASKKTGITFY